MMLRRISQHCVVNKLTCVGVNRASSYHADDHSLRPMSSFSHKMHNIHPTHVLTGRRHIPNNACFGFNAQVKRHMSLQEFGEMQERFYTNISNSEIVAHFQEALLGLHSSTHLPWWATIVISTVVARTLFTLPFSIYQQCISARLENVHVELKELANNVAAATKYAEMKIRLTPAQAKILFQSSMRKQYKDLLIRDNCHPLKMTILLWIQIPLWISMSFALRNLVYMRPAADDNAFITFAELSAGGVGWIQDLTACDSTWILPITLGLVNLSIIELSQMSRLSSPSKLRTVLTNCFRGFSLLLVPISANVPSCMCLYWLVSSTYGLVQNLVMLSPALRRKCRIPEAGSELEHPYSHIYSQIQTRFNPFKSKEQ